MSSISRMPPTAELDVARRLGARGQRASIRPLDRAHVLERRGVEGAVEHEAAPSPPGSARPARRSPATGQAFSSARRSQVAPRAA